MAKSHARAASCFVCRPPPEVSKCRVSDISRVGGLSSFQGSREFSYLASHVSGIAIY